MMKTFFLICCFMIVYPYAVYPLILKILCSFHRLETRRKHETPLLTFIISAFNEEDVIAKKIENTLMLSYPKDRLEIFVVSDHSTDKTDEIVKRYASAGVILLSQPVRSGKTAGLNVAVKRARGEILVFTDADSMYETDALKIMADCLSSDAGVGLVTGSTNYLSEGDGKMVVTTTTYTRLERFMKKHESILGSCVGADGAIFGMRKALFQPLQHDDINDLVLPLKIVKQGYRVVFHENLFCTEAPAADDSGEFKRQARITSRTLRALFNNADLMNIFKYPLFSFELISHKLLRLSVPFFMLSLFPLNILLLGQGIIYYVTLAAQIAIYSLSLVRFWQERAGKKHPIFSFLYHFILINISMLTGWIKFLSGQKTVIWDPQRQ
jgi:cellulose synthase/poly-beta-1,6-N-acetylglucosamine synthase-like glycosyltransferase